MIRILLVEKDKEKIKEFKKRFKEVFIDNHDLTIAKNANNAIKRLKEKKYDLILLGKQKEEVLASWIAEKREKIQKTLKFPIFIHSMDAESAETMYKILTKERILVRRVPYLWAKQNFNRYFNLELSGGIK